MIKIKLLASTAIASLFIATNAFSQTNNFTGLSLALTGSAVGSSSKNSVNLGGLGSSDIVLLPTDNTPGKTNFIPGADVSYGFAINNNFVMGIGASYDFSKTKIGGMNLLVIDAVSEDTYELKLDNELQDHYSLYLQPTYILNKDSAIFAKVGRHFAKAKFNISANGLGVGEGSSLSVLAESANIEGWGYGLGLKTFLTSNLFVQAEAGVVHYEKWSIGDEMGGGDIFSFKPKTINGTISIGYKF